MAVLYTSKPVAGEVTGLAAFNAVKVILGGKKPWFVEATSNLAEGLGVVVPIPVWAFPVKNAKPKTNTTILFFLLFFLKIILLK